MTKRSTLLSKLDLDGLLFCGEGHRQISLKLLPADECGRIDGEQLPGYVFSRHRHEAFEHFRKLGTAAVTEAGMSIGRHNVREPGPKQVLREALGTPSELAQEGSARELQEATALDELGQALGLPNELRIALGMAEDERDAAHGEVADQAFDPGQALRGKLKEDVLRGLGESERAAVLQRLQEVRTEPDVAAWEDLERYGGVCGTLLQAA